MIKFNNERKNWSYWFKNIYVNLKMLRLIKKSIFVLKNYGLKIFLIKATKRPINRINLLLLRKDSHNQETLEEVKNILSGNQLDFLFIDGDHTYEGVKKDFEMYSPLVRKGGIIAFHDIINKDPLRKDIEVPKFWSVLKNRYRINEIIFDKFNYGIGLLFL